MLRALLALLPLIAACHRFGMPRPIEDVEGSLSRVQVVLRDSSVVELIDVVVTNDSVVGFTTQPLTRQAMSRHRVEHIRVYGLNREGILVGSMIVVAIAWAVLGYFVGGS